jgi:hypothetical protein
VVLPYDDAYFLNHSEEDRGGDGSLIVTEEELVGTPLEGADPKDIAIKFGPTNILERKKAQAIAAEQQRELRLRSQNVAENEQRRIAEREDSAQADLDLERELQAERERVRKQLSQPKPSYPRFDPITGRVETVPAQTVGVTPSEEAVTRALIKNNPELSASLERTRADYESEQWPKGIAIPNERQVKAELIRLRRAGEEQGISFLDLINAPGHTDTAHIRAVMAWAGLYGLGNFGSNLVSEVGDALERPLIKIKGTSIEVTDEGKIAAGAAVGAAVLSIGFTSVLAAAVARGSVALLLGVGGTFAGVASNVAKGIAVWYLLDKATNSIAESTASAVADVIQEGGGDDEPDGSLPDDSSNADNTDGSSGTSFEDAYNSHSPDGSSDPASNVGTPGSDSSGSGGYSSGGLSVQEANQLKIRVSGFIGNRSDSDESCGDIVIDSPEAVQAYLDCLEKEVKNGRLPTVPRRADSVIRSVVRG